MPDFLDILLDQIDRETVKGSRFVKSGDTYVTIAADRSLEDLYGELKRIESKTVDGVELPVYDQAVSDTAVTARDERSTKHSIAVRDDGSIEMPLAASKAGLTEESFGDPVNFRFPLQTEELAKASLAALETAKGYTDAETALIRERLTKASTPETPSKTIAVEGWGDIAVMETTDRLGHVMRTFVAPGSETDTVPIGFVHEGDIAMLRVPKGTPDDRVRSLLSHFAKSAAPRRKGGGDDFAEALDDAMDSLACSALSSAWWAFCSCVMGWDGLADIDDATFNTYTDQFSAALKQLWGKLSAEDLVQLQSDRRLMKGIFSKDASVREKAGAALSKERREKLEAAGAIISEVLAGAVTAAPEADDDVEKGALPGRQKSASLGETDPIAQLRSEVSQLKESHAAELKRVKAEHEQKSKEDTDKLSVEMAEMRKQLDKLGQQPVPDPLSSATGGHATKGAPSNGGTIYDIVDQKSIYRG